MYKHNYHAKNYNSSPIKNENFEMKVIEINNLS